MEELINEAADPISKEMARIISAFFTGMEKEILVGTKKYTQAQAAKIVSKIGSKTLTADEISVIKALTKEVIAADRAIITTLTRDIFGEMQKLSSRTLKTKYFSEVKAALKNILPDNEVKNVVDGVKVEINKLTPTTTGGTSPKPPKNEPVLTPDPNAPGPGSTPLKFDDLPANADEIITATAKSSTEAAAYMQQVDLLGFNPQITKSLKLSYSQNYKKTAAELVAEGNELARMLNEKTYGFWKRAWSKISNDPAAAIDKAGRSSALLLKWVTILSLLGSGAAITFAFRDKIMKWLGLEGESIIPDITPPNLGNQTGTYGFDDNGILQWLIKTYPNTPASAYEAPRKVTSPYNGYGVKLKTGGNEIMFKYENGNYQQVQ